MDPVFNGPEADCRALLAVIEGDLSAYMNRDLDRQRQYFLRDDRMVSIMQIAGTGLNRCWGWKEFEALMRRNKRVAPFPSKAPVRFENTRIKVDGDMGWVHFDQYVVGSHSALDPPALTHNVRVFERHNGRWLIVFHGVFEPASHAQSAPSVEVDETAKVKSMNAGAEARIGSFPGLTISAGVLRGARPAWDKVLRRAIRRAADLCDYAKMHRQVERGQHVVFPVVLGEDETGASNICLVEVTDFSVWVTFGQHEVVERRLRVAKAAFGLSDGQLAVAQLIADGKDLASAAAVLGITVNTVRTHLRRMFDKTGVRSQTALLRVILSLG